MAYYEGLQKTLGVAATDRFARFFMLPGVKHCTGGEGPDQIDVVSAVMDWTERGRAPDKLLAGKAAQAVSGEDAAPLPFSEPAAALRFSRPIFPYPLVASYAGKGDPARASSYRAVRLAETPAQKFPAEISAMFGPGNQQFYEVQNGRLVPSAKVIP